MRRFSHWAACIMAVLGLALAAVAVTSEYLGYERVFITRTGTPTGLLFFERSIIVYRGTLERRAYTETWTVSPGEWNALATAYPHTAGPPREQRTQFAPPRTVMRQFTISGARSVTPATSATLSGTRSLIRLWPVAWVAASPLLLILALHTLRAWRQSRLRREGLCPGCGYNLLGSGGACPECGAARE